MKTNIPIEIIELEDASYHLMIEAKFNHKLSGNLIIDTGASKTVFDQNFVETFALNIEEIENQDSSGINAMITNAHIGIIDHFQVGKLKVENYQVLLLDLSHINHIYKKYSKKKIAGLIGSDFLVDHKAVINYGTKKLTLEIEPLPKS